MASHLSVKISDRQQLLETLNTGERLERVLALIEAEIGVLQVERKIRSRVKRQMEKTQREYYSTNSSRRSRRSWAKARKAATNSTRSKCASARTKLSKEAREKATAEVKKLRSMSPMSAEATVVRNYLDWMLSLPWGKKSKVKKDIQHAEDILQNDHYGLEKVKERILEYLAVAAARRQDEGADPVPGRASGRRQDLARQVDRQGDGARVRAHVAGRRARRGRDPRPPAYLYRLDAR